MQSVDDIFAIFGNPRSAVRNFAQALAEKPDTVYRWRKSGRIPETAWPKVITAARSKGNEITADVLLHVNRTPRQRGRPAHRKPIAKITASRRKRRAL